MKKGPYGIKCKKCSENIGSLSECCMYCGEKTPTLFEVSPDDFKEYSERKKDFLLNCNAFSHTLKIFLFKNYKKIKKAYCPECGQRLF